MLWLVLNTVHLRRRIFNNTPREEKNLPVSPYVFFLLCAFDNLYGKEGFPYAESFVLLIKAVFSFLLLPHDGEQLVTLSSPPPCLLQMTHSLSFKHDLNIPSSSFIHQGPPFPKSPSLNSELCSCINGFQSILTAQSYGGRESLLFSADKVLPLHIISQPLLCYKGEIFIKQERWGVWSHKKNKLPQIKIQLKVSPNYSS